MATAGKVSIDLETLHASFTKGIDKANESLHQLGDTAESIKGMVEGALAFAGIELGVSKLKEIYTATSENVVASYRLSSALGISTTSLQELQAAGVSAGIQHEAFNGILQKLTKQLGGAEEGGGKAADALKRLGLSGDELKGAKVDDVFKRIGEEIGKVKDPVERAKDELALFGKQGQQLDPLFQKGKEGIEEAAAEAHKFGTALSEADNAKVMAANKSFEQMGEQIQGVENQLVVALAPILETIVKKVLDIIPAADKMQSAFVSGLRYVAQGIGYVQDAWKVLEIGAQGVSYGIVSGIELITKSVQLLAEGIVWVANKLARTPAYRHG